MCIIYYNEVQNLLIFNIGLNLPNLFFICRRKSHRKSFVINVPAPLNFKHILLGTHKKSFDAL